ncbi:DMT family transporter [Sphingomonas sp. HDW15A]|uniref:DMT family transporter n=1 Tax=Sphingomonas sp. HDW15A TaxID=2714942 RepID=UPI001409C8DF|nr:DMT family transporter [Sphingomonas sp. HDW15A]QIK97049.1 DMT family transporter [Sphingomonas sp. HDW15A]
MNNVRQQPYLAFAAALLAIGALSTMDAVMKGLAQDLGAFATMCWRSVAATLLVAPIYFATRKRWPTARAMKLHLLRGTLMIPMSFLFFWGLALVPMAQAIALTFVAPLIALVLAALFLDEPVGKRMTGGSLLAFAGVVLIFIGQGRADLGDEALWGSIAILGSAICYAVNIVVMRRQAQNARPLEIAFFQFLVGGVGFWLAALAVGIPDYPQGAEGGLLLATLLAIAGMLLLAWAYARAGAAYLSATEYSGFLYAAVLGWLVFAEVPSLFTVAGATLIIAGCLLAAKTRKIEHPTLESQG